MSAETSIDELFDAVVLSDFEELEGQESTGYQQEAETFSWASDDQLSSEESSVDVNTQATNTSNNQESTEVFNRLMDTATGVATQPTSSTFNYGDNDNWQESATITESDTFRQTTTTTLTSKTTFR
ncbi:hypothetical protein BGX23_005538 [Mortierella sp. AD031]|nr:hypothetical protein BGX23_005538 [Mortierella sp. AD031]